MTQIWSQLFRYWFVALFPNSNARSNSTDIWNEIFTKKKVAFRNGIQSNKRYHQLRQKYLSNVLKHLVILSGNLTWSNCKAWRLVCLPVALVQPREPDSSLETMFSVDFCFSIDEKLEFLNHLLHKMVLIWLFCR